MGRGVKSLVYHELNVPLFKFFFEHINSIIQCCRMFVVDIFCGCNSKNNFRCKIIRI